MSDIVIVKCNVLNAVQSQEIIDLKDRIKRLEEAGDRAIENSYYPDRVKVWEKAKETKP